MIDVTEQEVFKFLDNLRKSGVTNKFGARTWLMEEYDMTKKESREYLTRWMKTFSDRHPRVEDVQDDE